MYIYIRNIYLYIYIFVCMYVLYVYIGHRSPIPDASWCWNLLIPTFTPYLGSSFVGKHGIHGASGNTFFNINLVGGFIPFQHVSQIGSSSPIKGENERCSKPATSILFVYMYSNNGSVL